LPVTSHALSKGRYSVAFLLITLSESAPNGAAPVKICFSTSPLRARAKTKLRKPSELVTTWDGWPKWRIP